VLAIHGRHRSRASSPSISVSDGDFILSPTPLQLNLTAPVLQSFTLYGFSLGQPTGHIVNLTELHLNRDNRDPPPSMTYFLDLLESNMNLRRIFLIHAGPYSDDGDPDRIVHLNSLEFLTMEGTTTKGVLNHLSLPDTVNIIIRDIDVSDREGIVEEDLPASLAHLPSTQDFAIISINIPSFECFSISAHRPMNAGSLLLDGFLLSIHSDYIQFFRPLSVAHVRELWLECSSFKGIGKEMIDEYLRSILFSLPALDALILVECDLGSIFQILRPRDGHMPCPSLSSLTIYEPFSTGYLGVSDLAAIRESEGAPLKKITILRYRDEMLEGIECLPKCVDVVGGCELPPEFPFEIESLRPIIDLDGIPDKESQQIW
jgi:hypothetical protein